MTDRTQAAVDAIAYPPTMTYEVATLRPLGPLAARVERIRQLCPAFFSAGRFLDVGASKGFFSLKAQAAGAHVLAVEPDSVALAAWADLAIDPEDDFETYGGGHVRQLQGTFASLSGEAHGRFDTVWIGNGPHYLYREDPAWVERLRGLAFGRVLAEGPVGRKCRDVAAWEIVIEEDQFLAEMEAAGFRLVNSAPSPSYTPDRRIWNFQRQ